MTSRIVAITPEANDDLNQARVWLHQRGAAKVARRRFMAITNAIRTLETDPVRYRRDPEDARRRVASVAGYRIVYEVDPDTGDNATAGNVTVLAILGPGEP